MSTIKRFEDLEIWQQARELHTKLLKLVETTSLSKDFSLKDQILRSSGSVKDNITEGFERNGNKEFINFLYIAKGSLGEVRSQVYRLADAKYIDENVFNTFVNDCLNLSGKIARFIDYISNSEYKGNKYK